MCEMYIPIRAPLWKIHYGHFMRDFMMSLFWYLHKTKILYRKDLKLYFQKRSRGDWSPKMKEFMADIFPYVEFWNHNGHRGKGAEKMLRPFERWAPWKSIHKNWGGDHANFVKLAPNLFRDYCFEKMDINPKLKRQILYVPRKKEEPCRNLNDKELHTQLLEFGKNNGYELIHWENDDKSIREQMIAYSESEIIVGCTGSDFTNGYWTDKNQLIIEIIPDNHYPGLCGWAYSPDILSHAKKKWESQFKAAREQGGGPLDRAGDTYLPKPSHERNWNLIFLSKENMTFLPGGHDAYHRPQKRCEIFTSTEDRKRISKLINDFIV